MKTLYLLRHAHTTSAVPPLMGDHERTLSPQGTEEALAVGHYMQEHKLYPDFVLSSSSVRTIQTTRLIFSILFQTVGTKVDSHFSRHLYLSSAEKILSEIQMIDDSIERLMVIGHNSGVADLALSLGEPKVHQKLWDYAPATLTIFTGNCEKWSGFSPKTVHLEEIYMPGV